jgi:hypothetical protein
MKTEKLVNIITIITIIVFLVFVFTITPSRDEVQGLEGGNIERAIETNQLN